MLNLTGLDTVCNRLFVIISLWKWMEIPFIPSMKGKAVMGTGYYHLIRFVKEPESST